MVPLIERSDYVTVLRRNSKFNLFFCWLYNIPIENYFNSQAEIDEIFHDIIKSLNDNDAVQFKLSFNKISAREPTSRSPFTNDDLLLFVLIAGIKHFNHDMSWLQKVIDVRDANNNESKFIKLTFHNILNGNYTSNDNAFQIVLPLGNLISKNLLSWNEKMVLYNKIVLLPFPFYKSELLNILSLRSYDLIIIEGDSSRNSSYYQLSSFKNIFLKKVNLISTYLYYLLCFIVIGLVILIVVEKFFESTVANIGSIIGILGTGLVSVINREKLVNWLNQLLQNFFGLEQQ